MGFSWKASWYYILYTYIVIVLTILYILKYKLKAIAAFRTLLAYALGSEIREIEEKELKFAQHLAKV